MALPTDSRPLDDRMTVSGQITADQVADIAAAGFKAIICNRPDGEAPGQPASADIAAEAQRLGLSFHYIPVYPAGMTPENVAQTTVAMADTDGPVFAYCRSGARSTAVYSMSLR